MLTCVIIDDEADSREVLKDLLVMLDAGVEVVAEATSVTKAFEAINRHAPDLILLDVLMEDGTGFDLLKMFSEINFKIIFTTGYQQYAINAFRFSAIDYLLKPVLPEHLYEAIKKAKSKAAYSQFDIRLKTLLENMNQPRQRQQKIILKNMERVYAVDTADITRCESDGSYTNVFLNGKKSVLVSRLIKDFEDLLTPFGFLRIHQSHLINMDYLFYFEKTNNQVIMKDNSAVPVSTRRKDHLLSVMNGR